MHSRYLANCRANFPTYRSANASRSRCGPDRRSNYCLYPAAHGHRPGGGADCRADIRSNCRAHRGAYAAAHRNRHQGGAANGGAGCRTNECADGDRRCGGAAGGEFEECLSGLSRSLRQTRHCYRKLRWLARRREDDTAPLCSS
jgi:hypothetical protein